VRVPPPAGDPSARPACERVAAALPHRVLDGEHRDTEPADPRTAAWGDPPVVLRCGVERPPGLTATSEVLEVEGVEWFLTESEAALTFTTVGRRAYVEVTVPTSVERSAATGALVDLAPAVAGENPVVP
jgi:hypothetical protein